MTKAKYLSLFAVVLITVLFSILRLPSVQAQVSAGPIILNIQGDFWAWDSAEQPMIQLTTWGMNGQPILSPDGTRIAYTSTASIFVDWLKTVNGAGGFIPPENIWLLDIPSGQTSKIADQPEDAAFNGPVDPGKYTLRGKPVWSPDGQSLAWFESIVDTLSFKSDEHVGTGQLVVYDLASASVHVLDSFPVSNSLARSGAVNVQWGRPGILMKIGFPEQAPEPEIRIYEPSGTLITDMPLEKDVSDAFAFAIWIQNGDQDYLFDPRSSETWLNWHTGKAETTPGTLEMYSLSAPDGAHFLASGDSWTLVLPGQSPIDLGNHIQPYGISRDGQAVIYGRWEVDPATGYYAYTAIVQSQSQMIEIGRYQEIQPVWGPTTWQIKPGSSTK